MATVSKLQKREGPTNLLDGWTFVGDGAASGVPIYNSALGDRCVSVSGAMDGASITIEGTNDHDEDGQAVWFALKDTFGNALTFANVTGMRQILETPYRTRATISGAGASTDCKVTIHARRTVR